MGGSHSELAPFCVEHPTLLPSRSDAVFHHTFVVFFCSFCPCSAAAGCQENQGLSLCLQQLLCAQHRVTVSVTCFFKTPGNPFAPYTPLPTIPLYPPEGNEIFSASQPVPLSCETLLLYFPLYTHSKKVERGWLFDYVTLNMSGAPSPPAVSYIFQPPGQSKLGLISV